MGISTMRPHLLLLTAVVLSACAKTEQAADTTTPAAAAPAPAPAAPAIALADVAGTWEGKIMPVDRDTTVATSTLVATATNDGWSMTLSNGAKVPLTVTAVAGDSIVLTSAGFKSAVRKGQDVKSTHAIYRLRDGKLIGTTHATYANGDTATFRTESTKK
jgi:hypothetical protein